MTPTPNVETNQSSDEVIAKYKNILKANGVIDEVADVIVKDAGLRGEGMASKSLYVTVIFENPTLKNLNLFVKAPTDNEMHTAMLKEMKIFEKEARFLTEYVPDAQKFCKSKGHEDLMEIYPRCYHGDGDSTVLENLVLDKSFTLVDKEVRQNLEEAKFGMRTIAKHHAISHAMIQHSGGSDRFFEKYPLLDHEIFFNEMSATTMGPWIDNGIKTVIQILETHDEEGSAAAVDFLKQYIGKAFKIMADTLKFSPNEEPLLLLNHGDYHTNNMMYLRSKETGEPIGHKAIDFQVTRYNSPATDISYYLFTSLQTDVRQANLKALLTLYLETLNATSKDLGHPIDLTYEELFTMFRRKFQFGYWIGLSMTMGAGINVMKDVDLTEVDMTNFSEYTDKLVQKWLANNPDKTKEMAKESVKIVNEFKQLEIQ